MEGVEDRVPTLVVQQSVHARNPRRGDLHVEKQVVGDSEGINEQIVQRHLVGHVSVPRVGEVDGRHVDQKQVDEQVVKIEKFGQRIVAKRILHPLGEFTFNAVHPIGPVPGSTFHGFVEFVRDGFPANDDDVANGVEVIPFVVKLLRPLPHRNAMAGLTAGEKPTDDWC